ncbi:DUF3572 domain-containing protein [Donghicola mangrovi]|uniref:DUF3572 domain-containing protein n=1 Tax=Donghicola mangrovi TaxID=2729614 RepID=A0A850Q505_9RHOB|nr:DUF3572 domain-containing protein [Donghicola mangrovi]NVO24797.1 DUF3572 domain-containing protein [Donghicola mangrovi]
MNSAAAEVLAIKALAWLATQDELLGIFMGSSGASPDDLRTKMGDPEFLGAVLDFITMDDAWVVQFCNKAGLAYDMPLRARQALPGGEQVHWT